MALLLAAEDYDFVRPLENPLNDARALEEVLEGLDFEVFVETNRDLKRTRRALEDFKEDAKGADVALLFFAGHGVALDGVNYLLPTDADAPRPRNAGRNRAAPVRGAGRHPRRRPRRDRPSGRLPR